MAVVVDICDTKHLTYSPINEKHNILYNNTRRSFNQRYKQKPWFRLNPFTDRGVGKGENLERYEPDFDGVLAPLQSLVIVEDFSHDAPQLSKEFKISEFWDYLFSGSWSNGCTVRVFEGQLMELLVTCLSSLSRDGRVVQHVTKAFAKNKRQKYSPLQSDRKIEAELEESTETLFLQFIYYGHIVRPACFDSVTSFGYPDITTTTTVLTANSSTNREITESNSSETGTGSRKQIVTFKAPTPPEKGQQSSHRHIARVRASDLALNQSEKERTLITRFLSHNNEVLIPHPPVIPRGENCRYTCSNFSNASDDYKALPPRDDLKNFVCTEKVSYLGEFNLPDDSESEPSDDEEEEDVYSLEDSDDFGQHYYLGDKQVPDPDVFETTEKKLKKRKELLKEMREARKKELANVKPKQTGVLPEFSELEITKYVKDDERNQNMRLKDFENVPTFEEMVGLLESEQKQEARKKAKSNMLKKIMLMKSQNQGLSKIFPKLSQVTANKCNLLVLRSMNDPAQRKFLLEKFIISKTMKKVALPVKKGKIGVIPLLYITTAPGVTYLHPVSKQLYIKRQQEEQEKRRKEIKPVVQKKRQSLLPTTPTPLALELQKVRNSTSTVPTERSDRRPKAPPKIPKVKSNPSDIVYSDDSDDSEDENEDDLDLDSFNTNKLNIKYSKDRIRKAKAKRKEEQRKEKGETGPTIRDVLKKYIRMNSILSAFGKKPPKRPRRSSIAGALQMKSKKRKSIVAKRLEACSESHDAEENANINYGKLKWFKFMDAAAKVKVQSSEPSRAYFENYPMDLFTENLERALKELVVRKEAIVSDYNGKSLVSITFTKKSVFNACKSVSK